MSVGHSPKDKSLSNPDLSSNIENFNITKRKRKGHTDLEDMTSLHTEILSMLNCFKADRDKENVQFLKAIEELRTQSKEFIKSNNNIEKILEQNTAMYKDLKEKVDKISTEHENAMIKISSLEEQIEDLHRSKKATTVEIRNIPISDNDNLRDIVNNIHNSLNLTISKHDLIQVFRLKNNQKTIIAEFQTMQQSRALLNAVKQYNKTQPEEKFSTKTLNWEGVNVPVYISEALTPRARKLHFLARDLRKNFNYKHCWTWQGKLFVKKSDDSDIIWIRSEQQIESLKSSCQQ